MNTLITDTSVYDISLDCRIELSVIHNVDILTTFHPSTTYAFANTVCLFIAVGFLSVWDFGTSSSEASKTLKMVAVPSPETSITTGCHGNLTIFKIKFKNSSVFRDSLCIYKPTRRNSSEDSGHQSSGFSASEQISALCGTHNSGSHSISWPYVIFLFLFLICIFIILFIYFFTVRNCCLLASHQAGVTLLVEWPRILIDFIHSYPSYLEVVLCPQPGDTRTIVKHGYN